LFDIHNESLKGLVDYKRGAKVGNDLLIIQVFKKKEFIKNVKKAPKMPKNQQKMAKIAQKIAKIKKGKNINFSLFLIFFTPFRLSLFVNETQIITPILYE